MHDIRRNTIRETSRTCKREHLYHTGKIALITCLWALNTNKAFVWVSLVLQGEGRHCHCSMSIHRQYHLSLLFEFARFLGGFPSFPGIQWVQQRDTSFVWGLSSSCFYTSQGKGKIRTARTARAWKRKFESGFCLHQKWWWNTHSRAFLSHFWTYLKFGTISHTGSIFRIFSFAPFSFPHRPDMIAKERARKDTSFDELLPLTALFIVWLANGTLCPWVC